MLSSINQQTRMSKRPERIRPRCTKDEVDVLNKYRRLKKEAIESGVDLSTIKHAWIKDKHSFFVANPAYKSVEKNAFMSELIEMVASRSPTFKKIKRKRLRDPKCIIIDPADIHIGKLACDIETGQKYNSDIAIKRVHEGVQGLLQKTSGYNIEKIIFVAGNDILHTDNSTGTTTKGTPQDISEKWYESFIKAKQLYLDLLDSLIAIADVEYIHCMSNHDYVTGWMLSQTVEAYYKSCKNIAFNNTPAHRKYTKYGKNLVGFTHGDGAPAKDLPLLMANDVKSWWSETTHKYIYSHHLHHKVAKDYPGVSFESFRSPSATDSWHHKKGHDHAPKAIEMFIHDPEYGQEARLSHYF